MWESLERAVREKAQEFIQQILEEEVTELLGREKSERGSVNVQTGAKHKTMPLRCRDCRKRFSVRIGTAMQDSNIPLQKVGGGDLPDDHEPQGRLQHEAAPRSRDRAPRAPSCRSAE